jgi:two-component system, OmpR family, KDP operon response regulator KdpE
MTDLHPAILIIEDELPIRRVLCATLQASGYQVIAAATAQEGCTQAAMRQPALILLDLGLPDLDGLEVTRRLREWATMPIIVLSARGRESDKIAALDAGADDYVTKPFGMGELLARIRVALRHVAHTTQEPDTPVFTVGQLQVDLARRYVSVAAQPVHLTPIEYKLLATLVHYAGKVVTHRQLLQEVWGEHAKHDAHYLWVYMSQLRHKLEPEPARPRYLLTEPGVGYRLRADEASR